MGLGVGALAGTAQPFFPRGGNQIDAVKEVGKAWAGDLVKDLQTPLFTNKQSGLPHDSEMFGESSDVTTCQRSEIIHAEFTLKKSLHDKQACGVSHGFDHDGARRGACRQELSMKGHYLAIVPNSGSETRGDLPSEIFLKSQGDFSRCGESRSGRECSRPLQKKNNMKTLIKAGALLALIVGLGIASTNAQNTCKSCQGCAKSCSSCKGCVDGKCTSCCK